MYYMEKLVHVMPPCWRYLFDWLSSPPHTMFVCYIAWLPTRCPQQVGIPSGQSEGLIHDLRQSRREGKASCIWVFLQHSFFCQQQWEMAGSSAVWTINNHSRHRAGWYQHWSQPDVLLIVAKGGDALPLNNHWPSTQRSEHYLALNVSGRIMWPQ